MGCRINIRFELGTDSDIYEAGVVFSGSQVKTKNGVWVRFPYNKGGRHFKDSIREETVYGGNSWQETFKFKQKCGRERRYRFKLKWKQIGDSNWRFRTLTFPTDGTRDTSTSIDLGDLIAHLE